MSENILKTGTPVLAGIDNTQDWHIKIPVPDNKNRNSELEIPVPVKFQGLLESEVMIISRSIQNIIVLNKVL